MWQPIVTYPLPTEPWDYDHPEALFYSARTDIVIGRCIMSETFDPDEPVAYSFSYGSEGWSFVPTHWMPLPEPPTE